MAPRPTPEDSLFACEKPFLQGRKRSSFMLSGWEDNEPMQEEVWDNEDSLSGSSIELATISSCGSGADPLLLGSHEVIEDPACRNDRDIAASLEEDNEDPACSSDREIAALMEAEWNRQEEKRDLYSDTTRAVKSISTWKKVEIFLLVVAIILSILGLGIYAVVFRMLSSHNLTYQCPTAEHPLHLPPLGQLTLEQAAGNNTSVCRQGMPLEDCTCHNPTSIPLKYEADLLEAQLEKETALLQEENDGLDAVFIGGQFLDYFEDDSLWTSHKIRKADIGREDDLRSSSVHYRLEKEDLIPSEIQPKIWWISIGEQDLVNDGCSLDAVHTGISLIVGRILNRGVEKPIIVLSPPTNIDDTVLSDWNDRLKCVAAQSASIEFFDPYYLSAEEDNDDDDDFSSDGVTGGSTVAPIAASPEEVQEAVIDKLVELLQ